MFLILIKLLGLSCLYCFVGRGGHKPGKHGKPGKLREFEKLLKSQGKLREIYYFCRKTWKTQGKCKICQRTATSVVVPLTDNILSPGSTGALLTQRASDFVSARECDLHLGQPLLALHLDDRGLLNIS